MELAGKPSPQVEKGAKQKHGRQINYKQGSCNELQNGRLLKWGDRRFRQIMNYGQGKRGRCGLLAVSVGTVRAHLVPGTEHLRDMSCPLGLCDVPFQTLVLSI